MHASRTLLLLVLLTGLTSAQLAPEAPRPARDLAAEALALGFALSPGDQIDVLQAGATSAFSRLGGRLATTGASRAERALDFIERNGALFGLTALEQAGASRALDRRGRYLFVPQQLFGHELLGHGLTLRFGADDELDLVHGVFADVPADFGAPLLDAEEAIRIGLEHAGFVRDELANEALARPIARVSTDGPRLIHAVIATPSYVPFRIEVDAHSGEVLVFRESIFDGKVKTGTYKIDGEDVSFGLRSAKGFAFGNLKSAVAAKSKNTKLPLVSKEDIDPVFAPLGSLTGRFAHIVDASEDPNFFQIVSPSFNFPFAHDGLALIGGLDLEAQLFDHANTYLWLTRTGSFFAKLLGEDYPAEYSVPAFVNFDNEDIGFLNAFFTDSPVPGGVPDESGYLLFGEITVLTGDPMDDFGRDPSIVAHEFAHMVVNKGGGGFGGTDGDSPSRGFNEGIADYAAGAFLKDPRTGVAALVHMTEVDFGVEGDALRTMDTDLNLVDNLFDVLGDEDLPEEHAVGNIFSATVWRARRALKKKTADKLFLGELLLLPQTSAETGHPVITVGNAGEAFPAYFFGVFQAWFDELIENGGKKGAKQAGGLAGAFMSHGLAGVEEDQLACFAPDEKGKLSLRLDAAFLGSIDEHGIELELEEGDTLSISLSGRKGTAVDFELTGEEGVDYLAPKPKKVNKKGTKASQSKLLVQTTGTYGLTLSNPDEAGGDYRLSVKVR